jgi:hypothetical protein
VGVWVGETGTVSTVESVSDGEDTGRSVVTVGIDEVFVGRISFV